MGLTAATTLLGKSYLIDDCSVEFYEDEDERVIAKVYQEDQEIGECALKKLSISSWAYENLPTPTRLTVDALLAQRVQREPEITITQELDKVDSKAKQILSEINMTIPCQDQNIKGSTLIEIVHDKIQALYAHEHERNSELLEQGGILYLQASREWIITLGRWKGMMPSEEVKEYFFYRAANEDSFFGVQLYENGLIFPIIDHRLHLPSDPSINHVDVTGSWEKRGDQFISSDKTSLSYPQIVEAIEMIKKLFNLDDSNIATLQLCALSRAPALHALLKQQIPEENQGELICFLDYLNGLMFGIEASGLNAALATGLMTLDLIVDGHLDYQTAFQANKEGGFYPYACFGNNTYSEVEKKLLRKKDNRDSSSMKSFHENTSLSSVAAKEAILIKQWLELNKVVLNNNNYATQIERIERGINDLFDYYFSPWIKRDYLLEKFLKKQKI